MVREYVWFALIIGWLVQFCSVPLNAAGPDERPILVIVADKMDSQEFYHSQLPSVQRLIRESACALMNVRSGSGYTNTNSGYLTIGAGTRSVAPGVLNGAYPVDHMLGRITAADFWSWSTPREDLTEDPNMVVPEIGWLYTKAETADRSSVPGLLGRTFRQNGWKTILIGNVDSSAGSNRPAGLLLMDDRGIIDEGNISSAMNEMDLMFPYGYRFSISKTQREMDKYLAPRHLVVVEFGDFSRLDSFREEMSPEQYVRLKKDVWKRFDRFLGEVLNQYSRETVNLILITPTLSRESYNNKRWLTPLVIRAKAYAPGLLRSGTTRWSGLVANLDILPTISRMAGLEITGPYAGRMMESVAGADLSTLDDLHRRINRILIQQRGLIDWYLGIISLGWIVAAASWFLGKRYWARQCLFWVGSAPLVLLILPLLPETVWTPWVFAVLTGIVGLTGFSLVNVRPQLVNGYMILAGLLWLVLTIDQVTGWNLIRFSGLGYSAASGSRYYGIGNEFMGIYLPTALISAGCLQSRWGKKWPGLMILAVTLFILGWPKFGINFGGTLAAVIGFLYYGICSLGINFRDRRIGVITVVGTILALGAGLWDASRPPEVQTHVGIFFNLILDNNFKEISMVILRKLAMNLKLLMYSPWTRIILLALGLWGFLSLTGRSQRGIRNPLIWSSILVSGIAAGLLNDSGVVAFGTCLAFGFTYYFYDWMESDQLTVDS
mgnify:CR=1 FL=1